MGPGPFLGDTVHHNFSSLGFFLHQDALHSCISKGSASTGTTVGPAFPVSNVSLPSGSSQLVPVINSASVNEGNYLLPNNPVLCSKASDDLALNVSPNLRQKTFCTKTHYIHVFQKVGVTFRMSCSINTTKY
jgi:hypothetical protein